MISKKILSLKPSATLELGSQAAALKASGKDVISLSLGEPDWPTFEVAVATGHKAIDDGYTKYTAVAGFPELRKVVAERYSNELQTAYKEKNVFVSPGGKFSLYALFSALLDPSDEVIIPAPYWVSYPSMVELVGAKPVIVPCTREDGFKLTPQKLESAINKNTKMIIINSPSNPTGEVYSSSELKELGKVIEKHERIIWLSDDIYNYLIFSGSMAPHILLENVGLKNRVVSVSGVSKSYSMTGWRIGWSVGPEEIISAASKFQGQTTGCSSSVSQLAALGALRDGEKELAISVQKLKQRRDFTYTNINKIPQISANKPEGAFYFWVDISYYLGKSYKNKTLKTSKDFSLELLASESVACVPGIAFGQDGYVRMSYAIDNERMAEALKRIEKFLKEIQ